MYRGCGSRCWHSVGGCRVGVNTTLGQGGCVVLTQGEPRQWVYPSSADSVSVLVLVLCELRELLEEVDRP